MEDEFYLAIRTRNQPLVESLLQLFPSLDVNHRSPTFTPLHHLCWAGKGPGLLRLLLKHPRIVVNPTTENGFTPFLYACLGNRLEEVRILLADRRTDPNLAGADGKSPLWRSCFAGHVHVVKIMIASGREIDWLRPARAWDQLLYSPVEIAEAKGFRELAALLGEFLREPDRVRHMVGMELRVPEALARELFASLVFLCDGYVALGPLTVGEALMRRSEDDPGSGARRRRREASYVLLQDPLEKDPLKRPRARRRIAAAAESPGEAARRFYGIASQLPIELQMILCHRAFGSAQDLIHWRDSRPAFLAVMQRLESPSVEPAPPPLLPPIRAPMTRVGKRRPPWWRRYSDQAMLVAYVAAVALVALVAVGLLGFSGLGL